MSYSSSASSENKDINNIRIILIRDYPSHGKKVIFDSASTFREQLMENSNLDEYDQIYDNYGYKLHLFENETDFMWSTLHKSSDISMFLSPNVSSSSVGSSFGNSISGLHQGISNIDVSQCDSGFFHSESMNLTSFSSISEGSNTSLAYMRRRMSGTNCLIHPLKLRDKKSLTEYSLPENQIFENGKSLSTLPSFKIDSVEFLKSSPSSNHIISDNNSPILALGIIFLTKCRDYILKNNFFLYEFISFISCETLRAYKRRKEFIHSMYQLSRQVHKDLNNFIEESYFKLEKTAWFLYASHDQDHTVMSSFVNVLCKLRRRLDTKETNFFFSTFLTGVLTHHLGWIDTIVPNGLDKSSFSFSSSNQHLKNFFTLEPFEENTQFWYNPQKLQYMDLHGKVGSNSKVTKTVLYSKDENLLKDLLFVTSYFIRCSLVYPKKYDDTLFKKLENEELDASLMSNFYIFKDNLSNNSQKSQEISVGRRESFKYKSFILGDSPSPPYVSQSVSPSSFGTLPYPIENGLISNNYLNEELQSATIDGVNRIKFGKKVPMPDFDGEIEEEPNQLPCLFLVGKTYMPGCICQGIIQPTSLSSSHFQIYSERNLYKHLLGISSHLSSFIPELSQVQFLSVNVDDGQVLLMNSKRESLSKNSDQILFSPKIANFLDTIVELASFGTLPVLMHIEDKLKEIYLSSKLLADYLLIDELMDLKTLVYNLDLDYNDVPLLYSVAATHTPKLCKKYGVGLI
ncbi:uncharacterized protein [Lepeophtheirus salmonis]|uniref:uncharacterized protein isoform X5 n=1 Tax=Lepeophtheirus salmonis TaxID=72036 RepID=UPI003AF35C40